MRVVVTGGTGFIGSRLLRLLLEAHHDVVVCLTRDVVASKPKVPPGVTLTAYDPFDEDSVVEGLEGADAVVNLAGASVAGVRWTRGGKRLIRESRVVGTRTLVRALKRLETKPKVLLSGSAIGFYGPREADDVCEEGEFDAANFAPRDFLSAVCREWEASARKAELLGMRVVRMRIGVVLGKGGGALAEMETPFKMGVGGPIGNGKQMMSWIHVDDCTRMMVWALDNDDVHGPLNVTAPTPVTNKAFSSALGKALGRPAFMPVPVIALRVIKGKIAGMLATGQLVPPIKATAGGFEWLYPTIEQALAAVYPPKNAPVAVATS